MTYREFYTAIVNADVADELKEFATKAITAIDTKNEKRREKGTPTQRENAEIKDNILAYVNELETITCSTEVATKFEISTNKAAALLSQLAKSGAIEVIDGYKPEGAKSKVKGYKKIGE